MAQSAKGSIPMELNPVPLLLCNGLETNDFIEILVAPGVNIK
jgi:hypothetical protein